MQSFEAIPQGSWPESDSFHPCTSGLVKLSSAAISLHTKTNTIWANEFCKANTICWVGTRDIIAWRHQQSPWDFMIPKILPSSLICSLLTQVSYFIENVQNICILFINNSSSVLSHKFNCIMHGKFLLKVKCHLLQFEEMTCLVTVCVWYNVLSALHSCLQKAQSFFENKVWMINDFKDNQIARN